MASWGVPMTRDRRLPSVARSASESLGSPSLPPRMSDESSRRAWVATLLGGLLLGCGGSTLTTPGDDGPAPQLRLPSASLVRNFEANPLVRNGPQQYDATKAGPRSILKMGSSDYRMWYEAIRADAEGTTTVAYATGSDGDDWVKHPDNPVMVPSEPWEGPEVSPTTVIWDSAAGLFKMWYHGGGNDAPRMIGYATSPDGLTWSKHPGNPVLEPGRPGRWDDRYVADVKVVKRNENEFLLWYKGVRDSDGLAQVGLARSADGVNWTKEPGNPVFSPSSGGWDGGSIQGVGVELNRESGIFHMWYPADSSLPLDGDDGIGYACSRDGEVWQRGGENPVLKPNPDPDAPDAKLGDTVDAYLDDGLYRVVYGAFNFSWSPVLRGMAEATLPLPSTEGGCGPS